MGSASRATVTNYRSNSEARLGANAAFRTAQVFAVPIVLTGLWYVVVLVGVFPERLLPSPLTVFGEALPRLLSRPDIINTIFSSVYRVLSGWFWASLVGVAVGILAGLSVTARSILQGPINAGRAMPVAAIVPLAILWFGSTDRTAIFLVFVVAVWPILVNTMGGVQNVPKVLRDSALTMGANRFQVISTVIVPASVGSILVGLRLGIGYAWMAVVLAELVGVKNGLGATLLQLRTNGDTAGLLTIIALIGLLGLLSDSIFRLLTSLYTNRMQPRKESS